MLKKRKVICGIREISDGGKMEMSEKPIGFPERRGFSEGLISAISAGLFFVLLGIVIVINLNLGPKIIDFFGDIHTVQIAQTTIYLPVPASPAAHTAVYSAAFQFAFGIGILHILTLTMRLILGSRIRRTAQTVGELVFWFGAAYMLNNLAGMKTTLAISQQQEMWFQFWAVIIILVGLSLIARAAALFAARQLPGRSKSA